METLNRTFRSICRPALGFFGEVQTCADAEAIASIPSFAGNRSNLQMEIKRRRCYTILAQPVRRERPPRRDDAKAFEAASAADVSAS